MHSYEIYLRMHLARAWQLTACSSVPRDACLDVSSSGRDVVPWGTATPGRGILKICSGVVRTRWDSHGLEAQFVDRGFYLCCQVNSTGRHVFSLDGLFDDSRLESGGRSQEYASIIIFGPRPLDTPPPKRTS